MSQDRPVTICSNMPFFHVAGVITIMQCLGYAAALALPAPHFSGEHALQTIVKEKCDAIYGTPSSRMI
jgi:acyl-CoA synthetase (AMP-forming)/AMP-acid ligase II